MDIDERVRLCRMIEKMENTPECANRLGLKDKSHCGHKTKRTNRERRQ